MERQPSNDLKHKYRCDNQIGVITSLQAYCPSTVPIINLTVSYSRMLMRVATNMRCGSCNYPAKRKASSRSLLLQCPASLPRLFKSHIAKLQVSKFLHTSKYLMFLTLFYAYIYLLFIFSFFPLLRCV